MTHAQHGAEREQAMQFKLLQHAAAVAIWQLLLQHRAANSRCYATQPATHPAVSRAADTYAGVDSEVVTMPVPLY
jgi:hypothetical protein